MTGGIRGGPLFALFVSLFTLLLTTPAEAARLGDLVETSAWEQAGDFFRFLTEFEIYRDEYGTLRMTPLNTVQIAVLGSVLLGLNCGLLGSFIVMRRMALVGDTLSHAVLPGIALGFLWGMTKNPVAILIGATAAGVIGILLARSIAATTRLKRDAALGLVLGSFFAVGICLISMIKSSAKAGIEGYFFGRAAALEAADIGLMLGTTGLTILCLLLFYKGFLVTSFDRDFAGAVGLPVSILDRLLLLLTAFSIVVAMGAVGVVLASAMLIIPAAAAYLLTDRMRLMLALSALFGIASALLGCFLSFLGSNLPTGPFMVVSAAGIFALAFLFGPRHGWLTRKFRVRSRRRRVERENTLKAVYRVLENREFHGDGVAIEDIAQLRREPIETARIRVRSLVRADLASLDADTDTAFLTPEGYEIACTVVRNHRLWELYLTDVAEYEPDHVHEDAEKIEHVLGPNTVRRLERALSFPNRDPHGKPIPSIEDLAGARPHPGGREQHGYG